MAEDSYYDEIAKGYDELYGVEQQLKLYFCYEQIQKKMPRFFTNVKTILDVGCGTGISSDFFAKKGFTVTGADPSKGLLEQNNSNLSTFVHAAAEELPFEKDSFDLVISFTAIQNFSDIQEALDNILRVGKRKFLLTFLKTQKQDFLKDVLSKTFPAALWFDDDKDWYCVVIL